MNNSRPRSTVLAALVLLLAGCQNTDPKVECARLEAASQAVVLQRTKPPIGLDPIGRRNFYLDRKWNLDFPLLEVANPYAERLKTGDPYTFCEALTGRRALPSDVPNPYR